MTAAAKAHRERREWTASVNGTGLRVEETGVGPETVVCSPALFTNRELFDAPVAALRGDYRCVRYDHRGQGDSGFGASQPSPDLLGTEGLYDDAVALLDHLGIGGCHWVGASVGGFVGIRLAARHPERIRSLTLIGLSLRPLRRADLLQIDVMSLALRATRPLGPVGIAVRRRMTEQVMRNMFGATFMSDAARADDRERWRQRFFAQLVPEGAPMIREVFSHPGNPPDLLTRVRAPTMIIVGQEEYGGADEAQQAQRIIPSARLATIPGAGHMVLVEQPETGTAAISEFIRGVDARQPRGPSTNTALPCTPPVDNPPSVPERTGGDSMSIACSVDIDVPVDVAFDVVKDPTSFNELMPGVAFTDVVVTEDGGGTTYRFETRVAGLPIRGSGEFTEFEANRHIHDDTSIAMEGSLDWWFEPHGHGVRVTIEHHPGRYWNIPLLGRLIANSYARSDQQVLDRLKAKLERPIGAQPATP